MTTRVKVGIAAAVAAMAIATAAPDLLAQGGRRGPGPGIGGPPPGGMRGPGGPFGFGPGMRDLDITDAQRERLKTIAESHREEFQAAGQKVRAAREAMQALLEADTLDEGAVRAKSVDVATAEADMAILNARVRQESLQVLTPEQLKKLQDQRAARDERLKQRRQKP